MDTKKYNFDEIIDRRNTESSKWGFLKEKFGDSDIIPLPVADMDLRSAEPINNALKKRVEHGIFGYTGMNKEYYQSIINWFQRKYNWKIEKDWIISTPGVVPAIYTAETTFSKPREAILIQTPAYMPFLMARMLRRNLVLNELIYANNTYKIDFDDLAEKADTTKNPKLKMMIICNPHNPVGRVWTKKELQKMGDICLENKLLVISDEIHQDLIFKGYKHTPFATISEEFANRSITCTAPSKTFNLAGLHNSNIIIPNVRIRKKFKAEMFKSAFMSPNVFGLVAMKTAYNEGENWLNQVLIYIEDNYTFMKKYLEENLPGVKVINNEGTYLIWVNFRVFGLSAKKLEEVFIKEAKIELDHGWMFGEDGDGFERFNIACPRATLKEALKRVVKAFTPYLK